MCWEDLAELSPESPTMRAEGRGSAALKYNIDSPESTKTVTIVNSGDISSFFWKNASLVSSQVQRNLIAIHE